MPPVRRSARNAGKQPEQAENGSAATAKRRKVVKKKADKEKANEEEATATKEEAEQEAQESDQDVEHEESDQEQEKNGGEPEAWQTAASIHEFKAKKLNGEEVSLAEYKGHVCIVVNVASRCGHTKSNYEQLVELYDKYAEEKGLRILAFPCNQFGAQEPGDSNKIQEFCDKRNVKFDVFEKINVNGKNAHDLYKYMKDKLPGPKGKDITWNFTKFIVNADGEPVERFQPTVKPLTMVENLDKLW